MRSDSRTPRTKDFDDTELVEAFRKGDLDAFELLVKKYQDFLFALALSYVPNFHDAQEIVQEAFLNAYHCISQLSDAKRFKGWLCTIVVNLCQSLLRRKTGVFLPLDESFQTDIPYLSIQRYRHENIVSSLWEEVFTLPEKYRMVLLLYYMNDYSYDEIAELLNMPVTTVKGRLQQARSKLRRRLRQKDREELKMNRIEGEFSKRVRLNVCQIATEPIREVIPLEATEHTVLFFGVQADIELRQHERDVIEISGTKYSLGGDEKQAQESVSGIKFHVNFTDDFWKYGLHQIVLFSGTGMDNEGMPRGHFTPAEALWQFIQDELKKGKEPISNVICSLPKKALFITVGREMEEDVILSSEAYNDEIGRIFYVNYSDDKQLHGPTGYMKLVVSIPIGKQFTIFRGGQISAYDINDCLNFVRCGSVTLNNVQGDVSLYDSHLAHARNVNGKLSQYFRRLSGVDWAGYSAKRVGPDFETKIEELTGELNIDAEKVLIEASGIVGRAIIKNRFGTTRFYQEGPRSGNVCEIWSSSGDVVVFLGERAIGEVNIAAKTVCGEINYSGLRDMGFPYKWNDFREIYVGTVSDFKSADIQIQTENGRIFLQKMALDVKKWYSMSNDFQN